jgi:hypothetical protein
MSKIDHRGHREHGGALIDSLIVQLGEIKSRLVNVTPHQYHLAIVALVALYEEEAGSEWRNPVREDFQAWLLTTPYCTATSDIQMALAHAWKAGRGAK